MALKIDTLISLTLQITDLARARAFYGGVLGLKPLDSVQADEAPSQWYRVGELRIQLIAHGGAKIAHPRHITFWVEDVHAARGELRKAGLVIHDDPRRILGVERFYVSDPDGNRIEFQGPEARERGVHLA